MRVLADMPVRVVGDQARPLGCPEPWHSLYGGDTPVCGLLYSEVGWCDWFYVKCPHCESRKIEGSCVICSSIGDKRVMGVNSEKAIHD